MSDVVRDGNVLKDNPAGRKLRSFIEGMPKTALHMHIEGAFEPSLAFEIAKRNEISPGSDAFPYATVEDLKEAYSFSDLKSFLDVYYTVSKALLTKRDFRDLAAAYCEKALAENVRHAEIFFDPQSHTARGIPFGVVADGINEALSDARRKGLSINLIVSILRDSPAGSPGDAADVDRGFASVDEATGWATVKQAVQYNRRLGAGGGGRRDPAYRIVGIGLDSNEAGFPPDMFIDIYAHAREHGLLCTAHGGEEGPPEYIREAIDDLKCVRIDHGVRSVEDPDLVAFLAVPRNSPEILKAYHLPHRIPSTVCPLSNYKLKVFSDPSRTNILEMLDMGMLVCVNSDDPAYFGGYVNENYLALLDWLESGNTHSRPITLADIYRLCVNGFEASWIPLEQKRKYVAEVTDYFIGSPGLLYKSLVDK